MDTLGPQSPQSHGHLRTTVTSRLWQLNLRVTATSWPWTLTLRPWSPQDYGHLRAMVTSDHLPQDLQSPQGHSHLPLGPFSPQDHGHLRAIVTTGSSPLTLGPQSPQRHGHLPEDMVTSGLVCYLRATVTSGLWVIIKMTTMFLWSPQGRSRHRPAPKRICGSDNALAPQLLAVCFGGQPHGHPLPWGDASKSKHIRKSHRSCRFLSMYIMAV